MVLLTLKNIVNFYHISQLSACVQISRFLQRKSALIESRDYAAHKSDAQRSAFPLAGVAYVPWS
jgi:hypothetical protein